MHARMDTLPLEFSDEPEEKKPRSKRLRQRKVALATGQAVRHVKRPPTLLRAPQKQICGFCGHGEVVEDEVTVCSQCGSVIVRDE